MENEKVLVVDDERSIRVTLSEFLSSAGYQVITAESGEEALTLIKNNPFDIAICDIMLPGINGNDLLCEIKTDYPETVVILITGKGTIEAATQALRHGAFDFLLKPVSKKQIINTAKRAIEVEKANKTNKKLVKENYLYQEHLKEVAKDKTILLSDISRKLISIQENLHAKISSRIKTKLEKPFQNFEKKVAAFFSSNNQLAPQLNKVSGYLKNASSTLNNISEELSLASLSHDQLIEKIYDMGKTLQEQTGISINISLKAKDSSLKNKMNTNLFFIIKEAAMNAIKHGNATQITIREESDQKFNKLIIEDNGKGFNKKFLSEKRRESPGLGILLMEQRSELSGGSLLIKSTIDKGTVVQIFFPIKKSCAS